MSSPQQQFISRPIPELFGHYLGYGFAGVGVSTAIGNYTQAVADLVFPVSMLGLLDFIRTYNSLNQASGPLDPAGRQLQREPAVGHASRAAASRGGLG